MDIDGEKQPKRRRRDDPASPVPASEETPDGHAQHTSGASFKVPGLIITDHFFKVPLDHSGKADGEINLFVREVVAPNRARRNIPYLLYLQGTHHAPLSVTTAPITTSTTER
jgi:hypothetical protein